MRVLMLSWEYPPMRVGGIAAALEGLAPALAHVGEGELDVHVVTCGAAGGEAYEKQGANLHIHRVNPEAQANDFIHWVHLLNGKMEERASALLEEWQREDAHRPILLHVHDWLGVFAGRALKHHYTLPLVSTIHATEYGRNSGIHTDIQRYIHGQEWSLQYESWRVIVCSSFMRGEAEHALGTPWSKADVIYNGINTANFGFSMSEEEWWRFRNQYALHNEKIIFFIGRMVREKGAQVLVEAMSRVLGQYNDAKLVIAGGGERGHLEELARNTGVADKVFFTGRVSDRTRDMLYRVADVAVYPSLYEPFGIVALEAMAAKVPVVVSEAGGLPEVVQHDVSGTTTRTGDPDSLAWGIARALKEPTFAKHMAQNAYERVRSVFNWDKIAEETRGVYERCWREYAMSDWAREAGKKPRLMEEWRTGDVVGKDPAMVADDGAAGLPGTPDGETVALLHIDMSPADSPLSVLEPDTPQAMTEPATVLPNTKAPSVGPPVDLDAAPVSAPNSLSAPADGFTEAAQTTETKPKRRRTPKAMAGEMPAPEPPLDGGADAPKPKRTRTPKSNL